MNRQTEDTKVEVMFKGCETKEKEDPADGPSESQTARWEERKEKRRCDTLEPSRGARHQFSPPRQTGGVCQVN